MNKDNSGIKTGRKGQVFANGDKVMIRRLGDGLEYRAKIAGVAVDTDVKIMIIEIVDDYSNGNYTFPYGAMPEVCLDKENWV